MPAIRTQHSRAPHFRQRRADCIISHMTNSLTTGLLSGLAATLPMTAVMEILHRALPAQERYPLPPRQITQRLTRKVGVEQELDESSKTGLTLVSHFAYGAAAGGVYAEVAGQLRQPLRQIPLPPAARAAAAGTLYGLLVWTVSYLGLLPAAGILAPATRHPARRNALMIVAHVIWGATLGLLVERYGDRGTRLT
ncbi:MAG: hypothetical protein JWN40_4678 [Phycisphaerales bacterium]|nr:hypothetical protein [Phycisphaerales bacterium]